MASYSFLLKKAEQARALGASRRPVAEEKAILARELDALVARGLLRKLPDGRYDLPERFKTATPT